MTKNKKDSLLRFACAAEAITAMPVATVGCVPAVFCLLMAVDDLSRGNFVSAFGNGFLSFLSFEAVSFIVGPLQDGINDIRRLNEAKRPNEKHIPWYRALTPKELLNG
jgi:hypothetical protein